MSEGPKCGFDDRIHAWKELGTSVSSGMWRSQAVTTLI